MWEVIFGGIRMGHGLKLLRARWFSIFQTKRPGFWTFLDSSSTYHFWWWVKGYQSFAMNSPCFFGCTSLFWKQPRVSRCYVTQKQFYALIFLQVLRRFSKSLVVLQPIHYHVAEFFIRFPKSPKSYTKSSPKLECPKEFHGFVWKERTPNSNGLSVYGHFPFRRRPGTPKMNWTKLSIFPIPNLFWG